MRQAIKQTVSCKYLMAVVQTSIPLTQGIKERGRIPVQCSRYLQETFTTKTEKRPLFQ